MLLSFWFQPEIIKCEGPPDAGVPYAYSCLFWRTHGANELSRKRDTKRGPCTSELGSGWTCSVPACLNVGGARLDWFGPIQGLKISPNLYFSFFYNMFYIFLRIFFTFLHNVLHHHVGIGECFRILEHLWTVTSCQTDWQGTRRPAGQHFRMCLVAGCAPRAWLATNNSIVVELCASWLTLTEIILRLKIFHCLMISFFHTQKSHEIGTKIEGGLGVTYWLYKQKWESE